MNKDFHIFVYFAYTNNNFYVVQYSMENLFDKSIYRYLRAHILVILDIFERTWRALCEHELRSNVWPYHIYHTISWIWILYLFSDHAEYKNQRIVKIQCMNLENEKYHIPYIIANLPEETKYFDNIRGFQIKMNFRSISKYG